MGTVGRTSTSRSSTTSTDESEHEDSTHDDAEDRGSSERVATRIIGQTDALLQSDEEEEERDGGETDEEEAESDEEEAKSQHEVKQEKRHADLAALQAQPRELERAKKKARKKAKKRRREQPKKGRAESGARIAQSLGAFADSASTSAAPVGRTATHINKQAGEDHPERATLAGEMWSVSGGVGTLASGVSSVASFAKMVDNVRNLASKDRRAEMNRFELVDQGMAAVQNGAQGVGGVAMTASNAGGFGATVAQVADASDAGATASTAFIGIGGGIETVSGSAQLLISTARTITGVVRNVSAQRKGEATTWSTVGTDSIGILKGALATAQSCVTSIAAFTNIAGKAAELMNALPLVGAAVNIAIQLLDIAIQVINGTKHLIKLIQAKVRQNKLATWAGDPAATHRETKLYGHLADVNRKRFNRELLPVCTAVINTCADLISIGGSVMNICGVATAPAYGAGVAVMAVGYGMSAVGGLTKVGTALAAPVAGMVRKTKQLSNDVEANKAPDNRKARFLNKTGISKVLGDANKSTAKKERRYHADAQRLFTLMAKLPAFDASQEDVVNQYERMRYVVKATGVSMKGLRQRIDDSKYDEAVSLVVDALKVRGG